MAVVEVLALLARVVTSSTRSLVVMSLPRWSLAGAVRPAGVMPPAGVLNLALAGLSELKCLFFPF